MTDRYILFSDIHLHDHAKDWRRVDDGFAVLDWVKKEAVERDIKQVFFLGDWFHSRTYLYPEVVSRSYEALLGFKEEGINITLLVGNHDMPFRDSTKDNSLTAFKSVVEIVDQPAIFEGDKYDFYMMPYVEKPEQLLWGVDKMIGGEEVCEQSVTLTSLKPRILLAHLDINDAMQSSQIACSHGIDREKIKDKFEMVITGHYHINQTLDNIHYIGSPYQQDFGESGQRKGFYIFDDGELEFVENTFSPEYVYLSPREVTGKAVYDNYVRIEATTEDNLAEIRASMKELHPRSFSIKVEQDKRTQRGMVVESNVMDVKDLLHEWVEKNASSKEFDKKRLYDLGMEMAGG